MSPIQGNSTSPTIWPTEGTSPTHETHDTKKKTRKFSTTAKNVSKSVAKEVGTEVVKGFAAGE